MGKIRILQLDGGGIKGVISGTVVAAIEDHYKCPIWQKFDLITGTSTGAILGACYAMGVPANVVLSEYIDNGKNLFTTRPWWNPLNWGKETYDRRPFVAMLEKHLGKDTMMKDTKTKLMITAFGRCANKTHFIKSYDNHDSDIRLVDVVAWSSLSAAKYFGAINAPSYAWVKTSPDGNKTYRNGEVMQDGGQGINNCTLGFDLIEILAHSWDDVFILSLGTGDFDDTKEYKDEAGEGMVKQVIDFITQARAEAPKNYVDAAFYVCAKRSNFSISRLNVNLPKKQDSLDAVNFIPQFKTYGDSLVTKIPWQALD